jgi:hypothetical protein
VALCLQITNYYTFINIGTNKIVLIHSIHSSFQSRQITQPITKFGRDVDVDIIMTIVLSLDAIGTSTVFWPCLMPPFQTREKDPKTIGIHPSHRAEHSIA